MNMTWLLMWHADIDVDMAIDVTVNMDVDVA
jgi:hypothetical protein